MSFQRQLRFCLQSYRRALGRFRIEVASVGGLFTPKSHPLDQRRILRQRLNALEHWRAVVRREVPRLLLLATASAALRDTNRRFSTAAAQSKLSDRQARPLTERSAYLQK